MCITFYPCADPVAPGIYWRNDRAWCLYDEQSLKIIKEARARGAQNAVLGAICSPVYPNGANYIVDLWKLEQTNSRSGQTREVKIVHEDIDLKVLHRIVKALLEKTFLNKIIENAVDSCIVKSLSSNQHAVPGTPVFDSFVNTLDRHLSSKEKSDMLLAAKGFADLEKTIRGKIEIAFHGTPGENIDSILRYGMDVNRRRSSADYFSSCAKFSSQFYQSANMSSKQVVVFWLINFGLEKKSFVNKVKTVNDVKYQLPAAVEVV
eukprot:TRINITY_DN13191_c0_g1_i1.p1 TRINITY_DN13191_c0_g1~~TRINITY_DN13191_c0_g1_i1.p1  ORF type:complete len:263 (-),score=51.36 TRINITY_DN13191_c0_g1_i1:157-945(-)